MITVSVLQSFFHSLVVCGRPTRFMDRATGKVLAEVWL